jgi:hypothetical protein
MDAETTLSNIEAMLSALPIAEREAVLITIETYGDMRADNALSNA